MAETTQARQGEITLETIYEKLIEHDGQLAELKEMFRVHEEETRERFTGAAMELRKLHGRLDEVLCEDLKREGCDLMQTLGYNAGEARRLISQAIKAHGTDLTIQQLVKYALKEV